MHIYLRIGYILFIHHLVKPVTKLQIFPFLFLSADCRRTCSLSSVRCKGTVDSTNIVRVLRSLLNVFLVSFGRIGLREFVCGVSLFICVLRGDRHVVGKSTEHQPLVLHFNRRLRSQFPVWLQHRRSQPTETGLKRNSIFLMYLCLFCYFVTHSAL